MTVASQAKTQEMNPQNVRMIITLRHHCLICDPVSVRRWTELHNNVQLRSGQARLSWSSLALTSLWRFVSCATWFITSYRSSGAPTAAWRSLCQRILPPNPKPISELYSVRHTRDCNSSGLWLSHLWCWTRRTAAAPRPMDNHQSCIDKVLGAWPNERSAVEAYALKMLHPYGWKRHVHVLHP